MKIWIINQYNMPPEYGHLNRHYNFGKYLKMLGHEPVVFVGSYLHNTNIQMIKDNSVYTKYKNCNHSYFFIKTCDYSKNKFKRVFAMFEFYQNLFKATKKMEKPDVIIGSSAHPLAAIAAIKLGKKYECQSIVEVRDLWPESFVAYKIIKRNHPILKLLYAGEKWIYKKADKIIFTMEGAKDYIVDKKWDYESGGSIDITKVYHLNNGVDLEVFNYNKKNHVIIDEDLENVNSFKVVYIGSIRLVNKIDKILNIAKVIKDPAVQFLIWGDGDHIDKLKQRVLDEQICNVKFKGRVDKKYVPSIITRAQLNIIVGENLSIYKYGLSANKIFDYFASGKPLLSTFKSNYSIIEKYNAGIELDDSSEEAIAEAVLFFKNLNNEGYLQYCSNAELAAKEYDFKNIAQKMFDIINDG